MAEEKVKLPKIAEWFDCDMPGYEGVKVKIRLNPSQPLLDALKMTPPDPEQLKRGKKESLAKWRKRRKALLDDIEQRYCEAVCQVILDTNIEGVDLSTPEGVKDWLYSDQGDPTFLSWAVGVMGWERVRRLDDSRKKHMGS